MKISILLVAPLLCLTAYLIALKMTRDRGNALLQSVTEDVNGNIHTEAVVPLLVEKVSSITNMLALGYEKLQALASTDRNTPTKQGRFFVGWDVRTSTRRHIYQIITYAHTDLAETTNGAWLGALASRTVYVRIQP